jgi:predicted RND superfamily exporter protein
VWSIAEKLNGGKPLDSFELALLYSETPDKFRSMLIKPYVSVNDNEARFLVRFKDLEKTLHRNELLKKIKIDLTGKLGFSEEHVHLTGLLVLYNNMLQSLFGSQIFTLGITVLMLAGMFLVLFRSLKIALIAMIPNVLPVSVVLGVMGWLNIPLDMMTITIAAISMGIAVNTTIHYVYRFKHEFQKDRKYLPTMYRCHGSIGRAMYYTSATIIMGFSILALSNFIPSVYFGLLTGLVMFIAFLAALTLLPQLLILVKPFDKEPKAKHDEKEKGQ